MTRSDPPHPPPHAATPRRLTVASYNIHRCIGSDGRLRPQRVLRVLREIDADIVALQEVAVTHEGRGQAPETDQLSYLAGGLGYAVVAGPNLMSHQGRFGNALLTRCRILESQPVDLAVPGCVPRSALDVRLQSGQILLRVVATHLGLRRSERREQIARLTAALASAREWADITIVLGDFNEWRTSRTTLLPLDVTLGRTGAPRTFPARFPTLRLDRIWVSPHLLVREMVAVRNRDTRRASDHLPVRMVISLPASAPPRDG
ncbi:MAG: endonuclease/exonuclease/phosphatase family protein [Alphaproteobacteria bacterium]